MANYVVEKEFESNGLKCVVVFHRLGHRCGYVGIPKEHPLYGKGYDNYDDEIVVEGYFSCHGGITYSGGGENSEYPIESDLWWFGFDCAHCDDGKDLDLAMKLFPEYAQSIMMQKKIEERYPSYEIIRDLNYVENECCELAEQLASFKG